ncbi:DUF7519 family protein [Halorientalis pallida]|uniref:DUF7519 family protein n=1 Tax=Halorientalis pallida TaxID=2479928 RepID=UPI00187D2173|nr:hypothetical protein [Halorientalis pallida]
MKPGRLAAGYATGAAVVGFVLAGVGALATVLGGLGLLGVTVGSVRGRATLVTVGSLGQFGAVVTGGVTGAGAPQLVGAGAAVVVAWTVGRTATELRATLDETAATHRLETTHAAGTTAIALAAAGIAVAPTVVSVEATPVGVGLLLVGSICLTAALALAPDESM